MSPVSATDQASAISRQTPIRSSAVLGLGTHLPGHVITNADLEKMVDTSDSWIMERTGIRTRFRAESGETTATMGAAAARRALAMAGIERPDVLICATCSPDTLVPSVACLIQRELKLPDTIPAFDINAACSGWAYGLQLANSLVGSRAADTVLVVCSEAMTHLVDYGDRSTCVLFGDGAGATLIGVGGEQAIRATRWAADGSDADMIFFGPRQDDESSPDGLRMAGRGTFRFAVERLCQMVEELAEASGWTLAEVDHIVPHQANQRIIEAAAKRSGIPLEKVILNVDRVGNTSAASIPLALGDAHAAGRLHRGDRIVCVAFGAGATWGGVALEWAL